MHWLDLLNFLPAGACLFWVLFHCMASPRTSSFKVTILLLLALGAYLVVPKALLALFTGPCLIPLMMHYLDRIRKDDGPHFLNVLWVVFPVVLFTWGILLRTVAPAEQMAKYEEYLRSFYKIVLYVELGIFIVYLIVHCIRFKDRPFSGLYGFLFKGRPMALVELQSVILGYCTVIFLLIALPRLDPYETLVTPAFFALGVFLFAYVALMGTKKTVTLKELAHITRYNYTTENKDVAVEAMMDNLMEDASPASLRRIYDKIGNDLNLDGHDEASKAENLTSHIFSVTASSWSHDGLFERFQEEVIEKQLFLQPGLSLQDVAERLDTNKTYVSKMVNNTYNMGFPELLNILRVDFAEQYLLHNREAKQTEVAAACGFQSASSFNNIFKKITGLTPKMWMAGHDRQQPGQF